MAPRAVRLTISTAVEQLGIKEAVAGLERLGNQISKTAGIATKAAVGFAAFKAATAAVDFGTNAITQARDLERNLIGLEQVFGTLTPKMQEFAAGAVSIGLSQSEAAKASTFLGSVLKQAGFDMDFVASQTQTLVGLAADLSTVYGYDVQEALLGMTALFRGEYDPIEKFGVAMKQSEINTRLAEEGFADLEGEQRRYAEQLIRLQFLMERSADSQGAFADGAGTLYVESQKLESTFNNMAQTAGTALLPSLGKLTEALVPLVEDLTPMLVKAFENLVPVVESFINNSDGMRESLAKVLVIGSKIITFFTQLTVFVINNYDWLVKLAAQITITFAAFKVITGTLALFNLLRTAIFSTTVAMKGLKIAIAGTGIGLLAVGIGTLASNMIFASDKTDDATDSLLNFAEAALIANEAGSKTQAPDLSGSQYEYGQYGRFAGGVSVGSQKYMPEDPIARKLREFRENLEAEQNNLTATAGTAGKVAADYFGDYLRSFEEEAKKFRASKKLESLGFKQGQIEQILGLNGWETVYKEIINSTNDFVAELQTAYNTSAAGIEEWTNAQQDAIEKAVEISKQRMAAYEKELAEWEALRDAAYQYRDALTDLGKFSIAATLEENVGRFASQVIQQFDSIKKSLEDGLANKQITQTSYDTLMEYVAKEEAALRAIADSRDDLANRYSLSKSLIEEYRSALTGALSLNSLFQQISNKTKEVTVTEVTDGVATLGGSLREFGITITKSYQQTVDEVTDKSAALIDNFRKMADKARLFADNLKKLKAMGLDPQLFSQLVQAGVEAGSETAQALVDGGVDSIKEMNSIYEELDSIGANLGEQVAQTLYGAGIDMSNGLLDGILSKSDEYKIAAQTLADTFATEFSKSVSTAVDIALPSAPVAPTNVLSDADVEKLNFLIKRRGERAAELGSIPSYKTEWRSKINDIVASYDSQIEDLLAKVTPFAKGGIVTSPVMGLVGEAGPEAIIPLNKANGLGNTYNIYVNANDRAGGKAAGDALITALSSTVARNGSLLNVVTGN